MKDEELIETLATALAPPPAEPGEEEIAALQRAVRKAREATPGRSRFAAGSWWRRHAGPSHGGLPRRWPAMLAAAALAMGGVVAVMRGAPSPVIVPTADSASTAEALPLEAPSSDPAVPATAPTPPQPKRAPARPDDKALPPEAPVPCDHDADGACPADHDADDDEDAGEEGDPHVQERAARAVEQAQRHVEAERARAEELRERARAAAEDARERAQEAAERAQDSAERARERAEAQREEAQRQAERARHAVDEAMDQADAARRQIERESVRVIPRGPDPGCARDDLGGPQEIHIIVQLPRMPRIVVVPAPVIDEKPADDEDE